MTGATIISLIRGVTMRLPVPPREVKFSTVLRVVLRQKSTRVVVVVCLCCGIALLAISINGGATERLPLSLLAFAILLMSAAPFVFAKRLAQALRKGRIDFAVVESLAYSGAGARDTLDSRMNGIARGNWRIRGGPLMVFEIDDSWAKELRVGSRVEVLAEGSAALRVFPLGLAMDSSPDSSEERRLPEP